MEFVDSAPDWEGTPMKSIVAVALMLAAAFWPAASYADTVVVDYDGVVPGSYTRIQEGIDAAADGDTVWVVAGFGSAVVFRGTGNRGLHLDGKNITLQGTGPQWITIDCESADRAFLLSAGTDSTSLITGFTFENGYAADGGGAIKCEGECPRIYDCVFRDNSASDGGAIMLTQGPTRITDCTFTGNSATGHGGGIRAYNSDLIVEACTFTANTADGGGGIWLDNSDLTLRLSTLADNEGSPGSAVGFSSSTGTIEQCVLAFGRGGRSVYGGTPETFHCCVFGNHNGDDLPGTAHDNLFTDPRLCDLYGTSGNINVSLCSDSPCLPSGNAWTLQIGSRMQGCGDCDSPREKTSWGSIKALYEQQGASGTH